MERTSPTAPCRVISRCICASSAIWSAPGTDCWSKGAASSSKSAVRGLVEEGKGGDAMVRSVSTMEEDERLRGSPCGSGREFAEGAIGVGSSAPSLVMTGVGEVGVSMRWSCGDSGENEGNEVKDLSEAAIEEAELDGCEVNLALLLLARTVVDLCELLDRKDCCETGRSSWSGGDADADAEVSVSMLRVLSSSLPEQPSVPALPNKVSLTLAWLW